MSLASSMESLRSVDLSDLDMNNLGSWPAAVKVIAAMIADLAGNHALHPTSESCGEISGDSLGIELALFQLLCDV